MKKKELEKRIKNCIAEMQKGIPNYFGSQRFGGIRNITHLVGKEFIKGNFESGVMLYLTATTQKEDQDIKTARQNLAGTKNFSAASNEFPPKYRYERAIIHHLCKYPKDFVGAFAKLPRSLRFMFVHAYQSHLFNKIIDERIRQGFGLDKIEEDALDGKAVTVPLFGFESKFSSATTGEIEKKILEEEGVKPSDFKVKKMAEISSKGSRKKMVLFPKKLKLLKIQNDELNEGRLKAVISFELDKGSYATTVLQELMKKEIE